jgi:DNA invertase Pin-like site-specific DNA recombinase
MVRAYSYSRVSNLSQTKGDGLTRQAQTKEVCQQKGWELDTTLDLTDPGMSAYSGKNVKKGALGAFLNAIGSGMVPKGSVLMVEALDRISRQNLRATDKIMRAILEARVSIYVNRTGRHYTTDSLDNPMELSELYYTFWLANQESKQKSERCRAAYERMRENSGTKNLRQTCPGWMVPKKGGKGFDLKPKEAAIVRRVFVFAGSGMGCRAIAKRLNREGIPPIARKQKNSAKAWEPYYVSNILRSRVPLGEYVARKMVDGKPTPTGQVVKGYYPKVVDEKLWEKAQFGSAVRKLFAPQSRGRKSNNLFAGLVYCDNDGSPLRYQFGAGNQKDVPRLKSVASITGQKNACRLTFRYQPFEDCLLSLLTELKAADLSERKPAKVHDDTATRLLQLDADIADLEARMMEGTGIGGLLNIHRQKMAERDELRAEMERNRVAHKDTPKTLAHVRDIVTLLAKADDDERWELRDRLRAKLVALIERIDVLLSSTETKWRRHQATQANIHVRFRAGNSADIMLIPNEAMEYLAIRA